MHPRHIPPCSHGRGVYGITPARKTSGGMENEEPDRSRGVCARKMLASKTGKEVGLSGTKLFYLCHHLSITNWIFSR